MNWNEHVFAMYLGTFWIVKFPRIMGDAHNEIHTKMASGGSDFLGKCRSRRCELGLLHRADGSARFQQGTHTPRVLRVTS